MASGSKTQRGNAWQLHIYQRGRHFYRTAHGSAAEADAALAAFIAEIEISGPPEASPATVFRAWAQTCQDTRMDLAPRTLAERDRMLRLYLSPRIGARRLCDLTAADGVMLQADLVKLGLAPVTIGGVMRLAVELLGDAVAARAIPSNPFAGIRRVRARHEPREVLAPDRFRKLAAIPPGEIADLLHVGLATGLRRGELLALTWQDVTPECDRLTVNYSLEQIGGAVRRKEPKSRAGRRSIGVAAEARAILRRRRIAAIEAALAGGRDYKAAPVFPGPDGVSYAVPDTVSQACRRALHAAGIEDSLHGLRHAHGTALLSGRVNPAAVQARLGHAHISTTLAIYAHALPQDDAAAVAVMDGILGTGA